MFPYLVAGGLALSIVTGVGGYIKGRHDQFTADNVAALKSEIADYKRKQEQSLAAQKRIQEQADTAGMVIDALQEQGQDAEQRAREAQARADAADARVDVAPAASCPPVRTCGFAPADLDRMRNASPIGRRTRVPAAPQRSPPPVRRPGH
jgi:hypothetical protein